jgi:hypothetical protein
MKRFVTCGLSAFLFAGLVSVIGCDGGGVETGIPANTDKSQGVPEAQLPKLAPMTPPGTNITINPGDGRKSAPASEAKGATTPK